MRQDSGNEGEWYNSSGMVSYQVLRGEKKEAKRRLDPASLSIRIPPAPVLPVN